MGILSKVFLWRVRVLIRKAVKEKRLTYKSEKYIGYLYSKGTVIDYGYTQVANIILDATNYREFVEAYLKVTNADVIKVLRQEYEKQKGRAK
jgi:hypothetical protein